MIAATRAKMPRGASFLAFNIAALLFIVVFVVAPVLGHFAGRSEEISESAAQLVHFRKIARSVSSPTNTNSHSVDTFLPGTEERVVSADLQASLKSIASNAGVNLLGVRGLPASRYLQLQMVAINVELEGSLAALRDVIAAIENQTPFLFVTAASFRSVSEGEDGPIRAELKVQGAMRDAEPAGGAGMNGK